MAGGNPTVLILGGGIMQLPAVRTAKERGWQVIVAAKEVIDEIRGLADRVEPLDLSDKEAIHRSARRYHARGGLDGVFTAGTDFSTTVAWVAERLTLPGLPYRVALDATDKSRMRAVFRARGLPSPNYFTVTSEHFPSPLPAPLAFPVVVKPVDSMGARGVRRVDDEPQLRRAVETALGKSRSSRVIVEEYLEGPELSIDAIVYRGKISICGVADRHIRFAPFFVEMGHTMPTGLGKELIEPGVEAFCRGIRALGIDNGAAKGDVKLTPSGPVVGEIAARLSGGYMSGWTFPLSSGVDVTGAALKLAVGRPPGDLRPRRAASSAERAFISIPGQVREILGIQEVRRDPGIAELFLRTQVGRRVSFPMDNLGKCGNVISQAPSREEAMRGADEAIKKIFIRLAPADPGSEAFLFSGVTEQARFEAFTLQDPENRKALSNLPAYSIAHGRETAGGAGRRICILPLPRLDREWGRDWHGLSLPEALDKMLAHTGARLCAAQGTAQSTLVLGKLFWRAFLKGSVQGGVYLIDTVSSLGEHSFEEHSLRERLQRFLAP